MPTISFIGDVHCEYDQYLALIRDCEYTLQLGDFGFKFDNVADTDTARHRFLPGNHNGYGRIGWMKLDGWKFPVQNDYGILSLDDKPELWVFGHHHVPFDQTLRGTRFVCVPLLERFDWSV